MTEQQVPRPQHSVQGFEAAYASGTPPWDIGAPQPAFQQLADAGQLTGRVLDVGCGTGEHALMAAAIGLAATGVDVAGNAIAIARDKAEQRSLTVEFITGNALELAGLGQVFDTVLDCGLFHVLSDPDRAVFVQSLHSSLAVGGRYFMLCFSDREPGDWGPRRIRQDELRQAFADGWQVESIEPSSILTTMSVDGAQAWLATIVRSG
ncbi:MAG TPA: class I SAM-dependent methyltransferase [Jatrophihabitans sp.]|nr:class I SAM-dependent methyltransferase [Jatrophihabitans sp.]